MRGYHAIASGLNAKSPQFRLIDDPVHKSEAKGKHTCVSMESFYARLEALRKELPNEEDTEG